MTANGVSTADDADMAECDDEKVVTMIDVLQEQQDFEDDANAVLGASDDKNCTYSKGYIKRQAIYACITCCKEARDDPTKRAGVCLACSLSCHENHELIELYTKRNFRCDCGNPKLNSHPCTFTQNKMDLNEENNYNQNFSGLYCICHRPYPDPESTFEDEMIQCIICEDWLHASHLDAIVPANDQYSEMVCKACMEKYEFLHDYGSLAVNAENSEVDVVTVNENGLNTSDNVCKGYFEQVKLVNGTNEASSNSHVENETKIAQDVDMTEEINEKCKDDPTENAGTTVPNKENMVCNNKSTDIALDEMTDGKNDVVESKTESETSDEKSDSTVKSTYVQMECEPIEKTETLPESIETAADILQDAKPEESVNTAEETNPDKKVEDTTETKMDKIEETQESKSAMESAEETVHAHKNIDGETSIDPEQSVTEQSCDPIIDENVSKQESIDENEDEKDKLSADTANTNCSDEVENSGLENTTAELDNGNLPEENTNLHNTEIENKNSDKPEKIEESTEYSPEETNSSKVDEENSSNDDTGNPRNKSEEVDETDTLEAATKELSDIMEDSNQVTPAGPVQELLQNNVIENQDQINESEIDDKTDSGVIPVGTKLVSAGNHSDTKNIVSSETENKVLNDIDSDDKTITSNNKIDKNTIHEINKVSSEIHSVSEMTVEKSTEIEMNETNISSDDDNKILTDAQSYNEEKDHKRKLKDTTDEVSVKKPKLDSRNSCVRPRGVKRIYKGATFWPSHFRQKLCTCNECLSMYKDLSVLFLIDPEDTVTAYETLGKERIDGGPTTQYEKGLQALSSLDRIQQINALTEYNKMRDKLLDFLKSFKDRKEIVKEEDIKAFFAGMKPRREPDGVYFCR